MCVVEGDKELGLSNIVYRGLDKKVDFITIYAF